MDKEFEQTNIVKGNGTLYIAYVTVEVPEEVFSAIKKIIPDNYVPMAEIQNLIARVDGLYWPPYIPHIVKLYRGGNFFFDDFTHVKFITIGSENNDY